MVKLPIRLGWIPEGKPIRLDKLPPLSGEAVVHVHESEGTDKAHVKLEYGDTPYCLSIFVFDLKGFMEGRRVKVRCYDLWPKEIMYQARLLDGTLHPRSLGKIYRDDAMIIDWGTYNLNNSLIEFRWNRTGRIIRYRIVFIGVRRYISPKYGYSVRSEYIFEPIGGSFKERLSSCIKNRVKLRS